MKRIVMAAGAMALTAGTAGAGGIDRSGQSIGILFEKGNYAELSFGSVNPSVSGTDLAPFTGAPSGNVAADFTQFGLGVKIDLSEKLSFAAIIDQPFGADVLYDATSLYLGGTGAVAETTAVTGLLRYKFSDNMSVHGGIRLQKASAAVDLSGFAYGPVNGYSVDLANNTGVGYSVGAAYEKPEIALRVALTYNSAVKHDFDTTESGPMIDPDGPGPAPLMPLLNGTSTTTVKTPQSVNLDFQSGVAADTLVFGSIRWADWSGFRLDPARFMTVTGGGLIDLEDTVTYNLGVGRKFSDNWAGSISATYEDRGKPLVSPLAPTNGRLGVTLAAVYTRDNMKITTGINYTKLGKAFAETGTPDVARAEFKGNSAVGVGVRIGFKF